ncbi:MAG: large conductance mechanosensitive channel protein MscL [bacterium]|nr:large conductance mechanosensitive channel protein MscL [bacterium]
MGILKGFKQFILRGNVVDLAVGVVVGAAFGTLVSALVKDILTPLIAAIVQQPDFSGLVFTVNGSKFLIGDFLNSLLAFLLVSVAVYFFVVTPMNALLTRTRANKRPEDPSTKKCPECLSEIPKEAKRCAYCTSVIS